MQAMAECAPAQWNLNLTQRQSITISTACSANEHETCIFGYHAIELKTPVGNTEKTMLLLMTYPSESEPVQLFRKPA